MIADFSKAGKYKGGKWVALENRLESNPHKFTKFRGISGEFTEVKRGFLYHGGKPVVKGMTHEFEVKNKYGGHEFAMTSTYFGAMQKHLKPFKLMKR